MNIIEVSKVNINQKPDLQLGEAVRKTLALLRLYHIEKETDKGNAKITKEAIKEFGKLKPVTVITYLKSLIIVLLLCAVTLTPVYFSSILGTFATVALTVVAIIVGVLYLLAFLNKALNAAAAISMVQSLLYYRAVYDKNINRLDVDDEKLFMEIMSIYDNDEGEKDENSYFA